MVLSAYFYQICRKEAFLMIDLSNAVFSCFGSHLAVFAMHEGEANANRGKRVEKNTGRILYDANLQPGFYFRNFIHRRDYETNLFMLRVPGMEGRCPRYTCMPEKLTLTDVPVELCYANPGTLLIRTGCAAEIACGCLSGEMAVQSGVFTLRDTENRYGLRIACVQGSASLTAQGRNMRMQIAANSLIRVDEAYDGVTGIPEIDGFDACVSAQRASYEAFLHKLPKPIEGDEQLMQLAAHAMWNAMAFARGNYRRDCVLVSKNYMCGMWSWDHCFAAMAMVFADPQRAWDQFMCVFDDQREDGRVPDCIEAVKTEWRYVKPPIHGLTLDLLEKQMTLSEAQRREAYTRLSRWVKFWTQTRDLSGDGLPQYLHGNDSGWDNNTVFDKPGPIQSAELPAYLSITARKLAQLAEAFEPEAVGYWNAEADRLKAAMLEQLFVNGQPISRLADTHERVAPWSSLPYMSVTLGDELPKEAKQGILRRMEDPNFLTPYGIASEALDSPEYQLDGYARGSIWSYGQFLPVTGLIRMGETDVAKKIMHGFLACCRKGGFSECFCSKDGSGQRDRALNWSVCTYIIFTALLQQMES